MASVASDRTNASAEKSVLNEPSADSKSHTRDSDTTPELGDEGRIGSTLAQLNVDPEQDAKEAMRAITDYVLADVHEDAREDVIGWSGLEEYLSDLCGQSLDTLSREPGALSAESERLRVQLEEVSCDNYRALIQSFECAGAVRDGVGNIRSRLDELVEALPPLADATRDFAARAAAEQGSREDCLRNLTEYGRIVDLLEMPRLMKMLIAEELYDEAIELHDLATNFSAMHSDEPLIMKVCGEVEALTRQMVLQLLTVLRGPLQLPTCLRAVGFLRRLGTFSEPRLRMLFLRCRGDFMHGSLESTTAPNAPARLVRLSDETRSKVFEIITQYRAAFSDDHDDPLVKSIGTRSGPGSPCAVDGSVHSSSILYQWTSITIENYLERLEAGLAEIRDGASLSSVLQHAMYCGQSLGRVGADFRPALAPLFEGAMLRIVDAHLDAAMRQFDTMVEEHRWAPVGSSAIRKDRLREAEQAAEAAVPMPSTEDSSAESSGHNQTPSASDQDDLYDPPMAILDSPPLAVFLNGVLAAMNELRSCALLSLSRHIADRVEAALLHTAESMSAEAGPGGCFLKRSDRSHFSAMHTCMRDLCVPHVARCLDRCLDQPGLVNVTHILHRMTRIFGTVATAPSQPQMLKGDAGANLHGAEAVTGLDTAEVRTSAYQNNADKTLNGVLDHDSELNREAPTADGDAQRDTGASIGGEGSNVVV